MIDWGLFLLERGLLPDFVTRRGIRRLLAERLRESKAGGAEAVDRFEAELRRSPIALETEAANAQHYEIPAEFYLQVLGRHLKYSSGYWPDGVKTLDASEDAMLRLYLERAELEDGQDILELGCGWGSLTLFVAEQLPGSRILAVSNSRSQRKLILERAEERGLSNLEVETADMNHFTTERRFDRAISIEMFEHMRNYEELHRRIAGWLRPGGKLFVHVFCHRRFAYPFVVRDSRDWMAQYFFTGGLMPSFDLLPRFQEHLQLDEQWWLDGTHYAHTSEAWLEEMDRKREAIEPIFQKVYGEELWRRYWNFWRVFFLSCAELFAYRGGEEWGVGHYRFLRPGP
jgi:cyclopropane-fatty-acyl-phospholipid synthase